MCTICNIEPSEIKNFIDDNINFHSIELLNMLKSKSELRNNQFRSWFENTILPRIIDEFNTFSVNESLERINEKLDSIYNLLKQNFVCT